MASDDQVTRFIGNGKPWPEDTVEVRVSAALDPIPLGQLGAVRWFIADDPAERVGLFVATRKEDGVEIGYWVSPRHWGRGIAGVMVDQALAKIPELFGTSSLIARVDPGNTASVRILSRRGFTPGTHENGLDQYILSI